jgi:D-arabinose 5-phosphate isomerase GutQ
MMTAISHIREMYHDVTQILIHCKKNKPLNDDIDYELFIGEAIEGDEFGLAPTTSTTMLLCVLDAISVAVSNRLGFKRMDFLQFHPDGALGDLLKAEQKKNETPAEYFSPLTLDEYEDLQGQLEAKVKGI